MEPLPQAATPAARAGVPPSGAEQAAAWLAPEPRGWM